MSHTVDGNSNALSQHISIAANKSWHLAQLVKLKIPLWEAFGRLGLNNLQLEVIRLGNSTDGS